MVTDRKDYIVLRDAIEDMMSGRHILSVERCAAVRYLQALLVFSQFFCSWRDGSFKTVPIKYESQS